MEQNVLVTKMIGIVVAVIVAAVVLVPICNSLTEGEGGSGGGEGVLATNTGSVYFTGEDSTMDITLTYLDENRESAQVTVVTNGETILSENRGKGYDESEGGYEYLLGYGDDFYCALIIDCRIELMGNWLISMQIYIADNTGTSSYFTNNITVAHLTLENGTLSGTPAYIRGETNEESDPINQSDVIALWAGEGNYVWSQTPTVSEDSLVVCFDNFDSGESQPDINDGVGAGQLLIGTINDMNVPITEGDGISNLNVHFNLEDLGDAVKINSLEYSYHYTNTEYNEDYDRELTFTKFIVPVEIMGSGGSSSNGGNDLGTAGTIIGIIPVFVILGIILGSVALFYQNRKAI